MADTKTVETAEESAPVTLESVLARIDVEPVRVMVFEKLNAAAELIRENNKRVLAIREAKDTDPNNVEYLDNVWKRVIAEGTDDKEMIQAEKRFQAAAKAYEKELAALRNAAKERHIQPPMSEEDQQKTRKAINEGKTIIANARAAAESFAEMADKMLESTGKQGVEGGVISLLPQVESLLNTRGRKASGGTDGGKTYATRIVEAFIDGKSTNRQVKRKGEMVNAAHFNYIAEELSKAFGSATFPANEITAEEVEKAYYDSKGAAFRDSGEMPEDHTFDFTKEITVQNTNDDSTKQEPHTKKIRVIRWTKETAGVDDAPAKSDDKPADNADADKK